MSELYKEAAELLQKLERRQGGLKSLAYADNIVHKRSSFALVCETLRYKPLLRQLLVAVPQFKLQKKLKDSSTLLYISLYDLLFGRQKIQGGGHLKKELMKHHNAFKAALVRMKIKAKVSTNEALLPEENRKHELAMPRYVRVNTLLANAEEIKALTEEFQAQKDPDVRDLLVLPSGTELHEHELVKSGKVVLQDKASCFPAFVLHGQHSDPLGRGGDVIDACAAPGNKTSHVAMLLKQQPSIYDGCKVFAFDRSAKRLDLLKRRMELAGASNIVEACLLSFLDVDVNDLKFANVRSILLDPSCSGSGMTNRLDHLLDIASGRDKVLEPEQEEYEEDVANRLQSLADFQLEALQKAFSFPQVERVVYSTCSIFQKENEDVVKAALASHINQASSRPFVLKPCLTTWKRRGLEVEGLSPDQSKALVRANGLEDGTNGFFVAYFERSSGGSSSNNTDNSSIRQQNTPRAAVDRQSSLPPDMNTEETVSAFSGVPIEIQKGESKKRKHLSEAQKENRKKRKREKRNAKKGKHHQ